MRHHRFKTNVTGRHARFLSWHFAAVLACDVLLALCSWYCAYLLRFDFALPEVFEAAMWQVLPGVVAAKILCLYLFNGYKGMWRFTSVADLMNIIKSMSTASLLIVVGLALVFRYEHFPRSIVFIDWCFSVLATSGTRLVIRLFYERYVPGKPILSLSVSGAHARRRVPRKDQRKLVIIGAGNCGEKIFREIHDNPQLNFRVVGFLDDNPSKIGRMIHGVSVLGITAEINHIIEQTGAEEALIAIPSASSQEMRRLVGLCEKSGIRFKTVPSYGELIDGKVTISGIREVDFRDLLGRETVKLDEQTISGYIRGRQVMVTGAGGSIGSELCRQICRFDPRTLVLFERAESPLYEIDLELRKNFAHLNIVPALGDIQDRNHLRKIFASALPQTVFHAAAYKHVPMLEIQPWKALENNILGTLNLVNAADEFRTERFVLVSTDKAVRPANVMGASKRVAEMIALNRNRCATTRTQFKAVRFGNVVGSVGSVVPLFKKQIASGGPVTVTHPDVTRYFMTIGEAAQLILQAGAMGQGGEIFILDMGTPVRIVDMARDLIRLSGFQPDVDIKIEFIGLRPGEKLYEELISISEDVLPTAHDKIRMLRGERCDLSLLNGLLHEIEELAASQDTERIRSRLIQIVPEYTPADGAGRACAAGRSAAAPPDPETAAGSRPPVA